MRADRGMNGFASLDKLFFIESDITQPVRKWSGRDKGEGENQEGAVANSGLIRMNNDKAR